MKKKSAAAAKDSNDEIAALVRTLHETQQRLMELTRGEVDAVVYGGDQSYLLREAQEKLRRSEAAQRQFAETQLAILNALPAHIALLDASGTIVSVNDAWQQFASDNLLQGPGFGVGQNYLEVCERATGDFSDKARATAMGIRRLLQGKAKDFAMEYPCHTPTEQFWFRLTVTPVRKGGAAGAVVMHSNVTARKLAEEVLRASEANMAAAQRIAHLGSWELQLNAAKKVEANPLRWSDEMFRIAGFEPGAVKVTNEFFFSLVPEAEHEPIRQAVAAAIRERKQYSIVHRFIRPGGEERIVHQTAQVFFDEKSGQPLKMVGTAHDITERTKAEALLQKSEEQFRSIFTSAATGIAISAPEGFFLQANAAYCEMLGYTEDELRTRDFASVTHPEDLPFNLKLRSELLSGRRQSFVMEKRYLKKNGDIVWTHLSVSAVHAADGQVERLIVVAENITERKRLETRFRRLVDSNAQGVFFWNTKGEITGGNDAFLKLTRFSRKDLEAGRMNWVAMTPPEYAHLDQRALKELEATGVCALFEKELIRKDGTRVFILLGAAMFEDSPKEGVCFALDITERKKLEQQFLRSQRMESIGTLAGGVAHDLNNILAPIMMSIQVLKTLANDPKAKEILETIDLSAKRGADIVRQVLAFARGLEGEKVEIQPRRLLEDFKNIIKDTFPKDVRLKFSIPDNIWTILGDATQMHQILLNLCVNARDAMPHGGTLTIATENCVLDEHYAAMNLPAKAGRYVKISVADTGTGMPPELLNKIFEPFFTTKETGKATGLGLSTVVAIVKGHDGFVNVYSEPGKGSVFKVYLPTAEISSDEQKKTSRKAGLARGKGELVLVVDDESAIVSVTTQTLRAFGYRVLVATDGADAVAVYLEHKNEIAVVLTDMMMPVMDGSAMIHALMRLNPQIKIIATSGLNANSSVAKLPAANVRYFLVKPYTAEILLKTMRAILDED